MKKTHTSLLPLGINRVGLTQKASRKNQAVRWVSLSCLVAGLSVAQAADSTWQGIGTDLNTAGNWTSGVPGSTELATWNGSQSGNLNLTFNATTGGADGWGLLFTSGQTGSLSISNLNAASQDFRIRNAVGTTQGSSFDVAAGAGAVTIGGGANPMRLLVGSGTTANTVVEMRNNSANAVTIAANVTIASGATGSGSINTSLRGTGDWTILGNFSTGTGGLNVFSSGTTTLAGTNTATGALRVAGNGTTVFTEAANINSFSEIRLGHNATGGLYGTLRYEGSGNTTLTKQVRIGEGGGEGAIDASGAGTLTFSNANFNVATPGAGSRTLTLKGANTGNNTIAGIIRNPDSSNAANTLSIVKSGEGTWILGGANSYTGATTVNAGTLALGSAGSIVSGSALTISAGATFDVSAKSAYALGSGGTTIGIDAGSGGWFNAGSAALTFGNGLTLNFSTSTPAGSYKLFDFGSQSGDFSSITMTGSITGDLSLISADTWAGTAGGYNFSFSEATGVLSVSAAIPEPTTFATLAGALTLGLAAWRRRRPVQA